MPSDHEIIATLRAHGLSPSKPRVAIYRWLMAHPVHPTVDAIYRELRPKMPTLSRTTVYNVLHACVAHGLVSVVHTQDLELRYDGEMTPHAHFKCKSCGALYDVPGDIDALAQQVTLPEGCACDAAALTLWGKCAACRA